MKYTAVLLLLVTLFACSPETYDSELIRTTPVTKITSYSADSGGFNLIVGYLDEAGVVWATHHNPTVRDYKIQSVFTPKNFTANLCDLRGNTTYYIRAYITNKSITVYGDELEFTTKETF